MYQISIQSVNSFKSYRANKLKIYTQTDSRQTDTFVKTIFSGSGGLKTWAFDKNRGGPILHKSNTFSDKNVKTLKIKSCGFRPNNSRYEKMLKSKTVHLKEIYNFYFDQFLIKRTVFVLIVKDVKIKN